MNNVRTRIAGILIGGIAALALTACDSSDKAAPTTTSAPAPAAVVDPGTATTTPPAKPKPAADIIGPKGYRKATLGVRAVDAMKAGVIHGNGPWPDEGCDMYDFYRNGKRDGVVHISKRGIEIIVPVPGRKVVTPEGITIGSSVAKVKKAYPSLDLDRVKRIGYQSILAPGNSAAIYWVSFKDDAVTQITLRMSDQKCVDF